MGNKTSTESAPLLPDVVSSDCGPGSSSSSSSSSDNNENPPKPLVCIDCECGRNLRGCCGKFFFDGTSWLLLSATIIAVGLVILLVLQDQEDIARFCAYLVGALAYSLALLIITASTLVTFFSTKLNLNLFDFNCSIASKVIQSEQQAEKKNTLRKHVDCIRISTMVWLAFRICVWCNEMVALSPALRGSTAGNGFLDDYVQKILQYSLLSLHAIILFSWTRYVQLRFALLHDDLALNDWIFSTFCAVLALAGVAALFSFLSFIYSNDIDLKHQADIFNTLALFASAVMSAFCLLGTIQDIRAHHSNATHEPVDDLNYLCLLQIFILSGNLARTFLDVIEALASNVIGDNNVLSPVLVVYISVFLRLALFIVPTIDYFFVSCTDLAAFLKCKGSQPQPGEYESEYESESNDLSSITSLNSKSYTDNDEKTTNASEKVPDALLPPKQKTGLFISEQRFHSMIDHVSKILFIGYIAFTILYNTDLVETRASSKPVIYSATGCSSTPFPDSTAVCCTYSVSDSSPDLSFRPCWLRPPLIRILLILARVYVFLAIALIILCVAYVYRSLSHLLLASLFASSVHSVGITWLEHFRIGWWINIFGTIHGMLHGVILAISDQSVSDLPLVYHTLRFIGAPAFWTGVIMIIAFPSAAIFGHCMAGKDGKFEKYISWKFACVLLGVGSLTIHGLTQELGVTPVNAIIIGVSLFLALLVELFVRMTLPLMTDECKLAVPLEYPGDYVCFLLFGEKLAGEIRRVPASAVEFSVKSTSLSVHHSHPFSPFRWFNRLRFIQIYEATKAMLAIASPSSSASASSSAASATIPPEIAPAVGVQAEESDATAAVAQGVSLLEKSETAIKIEKAAGMPCEHVNAVITAICGTKSHTSIFHEVVLPLMKSPYNLIHSEFEIGLAIGVTGTIADTDENKSEGSWTAKLFKIIKSNPSNIAGYIRGPRAENVSAAYQRFLDMGNIPRTIVFLSQGLSITPMLDGFYSTVAEQCEKDILAGSVRVVFIHSGKDRPFFRAVMANIIDYYYCHGQPFTKKPAGNVFIRFINEAGIVKIIHKKQVQIISVERRHKDAKKAPLADINESQKASDQFTVNFKLLGRVFILFCGPKHEEEPSGLVGQFLAENKIPSVDEIRDNRNNRYVYAADLQVPKGYGATPDKDTNTKKVKDEKKE